jgi:DNA polymerase III subunit epsilon
MKIAVIDIETTGFLNQGGLIVEIGIVGLDLNTGEVTREFDALVKEPGFDESHARHPFGWIFQNSDLAFEDVLAARPLDELLPEIQAVVDRFSAGATAYNKQFDFGFLRSRGLKIKDLPCIMLEACPVVNLPPAWKGGKAKWPKVEEAWEFFFPDTPYVEAHRALDDAEHEALIAHRLFELGRFPL